MGCRPANQPVPASGCTGGWLACRLAGRVAVRRLSDGGRENAAAQRAGAGFTLGGGGLPRGVRAARLWQAQQLTWLQRLTGGGGKGRLGLQQRQLLGRQLKAGLGGGAHGHGAIDQRLLRGRGGGGGGGGEALAVAQGLAGRGGASRRQQQDGAQGGQGAGSLRALARN